MTHRVVVSSERGQFNRSELAAAIAAMPSGGIYVREAKTGDDQYAIVVSDRPMSPAEADSAYRTRQGS